MMIQDSSLKPPELSRVVQSIVDNQLGEAPNGSREVVNILRQRGLSSVDVQRVLASVVEEVTQMQRGEQAIDLLQDIQTEEWIFTLRAAYLRTLGALGREDEVEKYCEKESDPRVLVLAGRLEDVLETVESQRPSVQKMLRDELMRRGRHDEALRVSGILLNHSTNAEDFMWHSQQTLAHGEQATLPESWAIFLQRNRSKKTIQLAIEFIGSISTSKDCEDLIIPLWKCLLEAVPFTADACEDFIGQHDNQGKSAFCKELAHICGKISTNDRAKSVHALEDRESRNRRVKESRRRKAIEHK